MLLRIAPSPYHGAGAGYSRDFVPNAAGHGSLAIGRL